MNKKLMMIVAGALTALAFTALASTASAQETAVKCETGSPCTFTVTGVGNTVFSIVGGDTVSCTGTTGSGAITPLNASKESTTGNVQLKFTGCKETTSGFNFACNSSGQASGTITTNSMISHSISLPGTPNGAGVLLTGANTEFSCAGGFASTLTTDNVIGEYETACGAASTGSTQKINFVVEKHGFQTDRTYTGVTYDLKARTNTGAYATAAQSGTGILDFNQNVELTCSA